ncbi:hypothetical protein EMCRGX_G014434 [Ephydatia muelleri]
MEDAGNNKKKQMSIYDPESSNSKMQYEEVTVFLQEEVSIIRKAACEVYKSVKNQCTTLKNNVSANVSKGWEQTENGLRKVGITDTTLALQVGGIGAAMLVSYFMARKRTIFARVLYPTVAAGLVGGAVYLSYPENREASRKQLEELATSWKKRTSTFK